MVGDGPRAGEQEKNEASFLAFNHKIDYLVCKLKLGGPLKMYTYHCASIIVKGKLSSLPVS